MNIIKNLFKIFIFFILISFLISIIIIRFYSPIKQKIYNQNITKKDSKYTIICLGDSGTAGKYPIPLQKILDEKYPNKFSVVDCGIAGANLETILDSLDANINTYNPDIAICMMGGTNLTSFSFFIRNTLNLRLKYLLGLLKEYLYDRIFNDSINTMENKAVKLFHQHEYEKAEPLFIKILDKEPNRALSFFCLFFIYKYYYADDIEHQKLAYEMAKKAIDNDFNVGKCDYYNLLIEQNENNDQEKEYYVNKAINDDDFSYIYLSYRQILNAIDNNIEIKKALLDKISANDQENYNAILGVEYLEKKDYQKAEEYFSKAEEARLNKNTGTFYDLYKAIVKKLTDNNVKVICMQYPMRRISPLQDLLKNEPYYNKIAFISNEKLFKDAVFDKGYDALFIDQNSGDSGHCTDLGNTMIAENVVSTLEKIID